MLLEVKSLEIRVPAWPGSGKSTFPGYVLTGYMHQEIERERGRDLGYHFLLVQGL